MKKYLFIALAALGFVACAEKMDDPNGPLHTGELEESYIAINLMSADSDTRAITDDPYGSADEYGYEDGTAAERTITSAYFFFFDENGNPFNVTTSAPGGDKNYLPLTLEFGAETETENVSDISNAVLVLSTYKGVYPSKIVAVLNWTPSANTYTLNDLHAVVANSLGNDTNGYVMSNSVYMDKAGNMVDAVPLTAANIKTSENDAKENPVEIYVERTAAKVVLTASGKVEDTTNIFSTQKSSSLVPLSGEISNENVYVQLLGWELFNDYDNSSLLKNINTTRDPAHLGLTWNDIPYYRCYWAESQNSAHNDSFSRKYNDGDKTAKGFQTEYGFAIADANNPYATRSTYTYCGENTNQKTDNTDLRTKVILKGQLMKKKDDNNYEPLALARWYGTEYAGSYALKTAVANSLKYTLYYYDNNEYVSIKPEHLECAKLDGLKSYQVGFKLTTEAEKKEWFQYSSAEGYKRFGNPDTTGDNVAETNDYLKNTVQPALLYEDGMTYYTVDIKHLGKAGSTAEYGVVRNHVYQVDIQSVNGYGSPVYSGLSFVVNQPEYPSENEEASYVAARINVLSWKVVKQGVNVGN